MLRSGWKRISTQYAKPASSNTGGHYQKRSYGDKLLMVDENIARKM